MREASCGKLHAPPLSMINEVSFKKLSMKSMINESMNCKTSQGAKRADRIADNVIRRYSRFGYDAEKWRGAILKAAWRLSEAQVWAIYEASFNPWVKDSLRYFLGACRQEYNG